jgi:hypothetical protein
MTVKCSPFFTAGLDLSSEHVGIDTHKRSWAAFKQVFFIQQRLAVVNKMCCSENAEMLLCEMMLRITQSKVVFVDIRA